MRTATFALTLLVATLARPSVSSQRVAAVDEPLRTVAPAAGVRRGLRGLFDAPEDDRPAHTAHMDLNDNGISTDAVEYEYGTPIEVTFEVTKDLVPADVLSTLDIDKMDQWTLGIFMRMADPQDGTPIVAVTPAIDCAGADRKLGAARGPSGPNAGAGDSGSDTPPNLNLVGDATFSAADTSASVLEPNAYGTGFDIHLLDQDGRAIVGPATFYMAPLTDMGFAD